MAMAMVVVVVMMMMMMMMWWWWARLEEERNGCERARLTAAVFAAHKRLQQHGNSTTAARTANCQARGKVGKLARALAVKPHGQRTQKQPRAKTVEERSGVGAVRVIRERAGNDDESLRAQSRRSFTTRGLRGLGGSPQAGRAARAGRAAQGVIRISDDEVTQPGRHRRGRAAPQPHARRSALEAGSRAAQRFRSSSRAGRRRGRWEGVHRDPTAVVFVAAQRTGGLG